MALIIERKWRGKAISVTAVMNRLISGPQLRSCELKHKAKLLEFAILLGNDAETV